MRSEESSEPHYRRKIAIALIDLPPVSGSIILVGIFITCIDAIRAIYHHDFSRVAGAAILWVLLGPFLYICWQLNKA